MNENMKNLVEAMKAELEASDTVKKYKSAKDAYFADEFIVKLVNEYNVQRQIYETEEAKDEKDELLLTSIEARIETISKQINEAETARNFIEAENDVRELYDTIIGDLYSVVVPPHEHNCSGDCSSCGGCH